MRVEKPIGKYSEKQARKYLKKGLLLLIPFLLLYVPSIPNLPTFVSVGNYEGLRGFFAGLCFAYFAIMALLPYQTWKSGLTGERAVLNNLSTNLNNEFSIFNDVLLREGKRRGNIDHIVVGPTGVFVIETKNNSGKVVYDGR